MTLFDPYSHTRIQELRNEQLARSTRRREQLRLQTVLAEDSVSIGETLRRIALRSAAKPSAQAAPSRPSGRPALDS